MRGMAAKRLQYSWGVRLKYGESTVGYGESKVIVTWMCFISTIRYGKFFWRLLY